VVCFQGLDDGWTPAQLAALLPPSGGSRPADSNGYEGMPRRGAKL
jgi:hypothetical protein